jgi:hypothetical protein
VASRCTNRPSRHDTLIIPTPQWISTSALLMNAATWGTLLVELMIGILVWNRRCRPVVLVVGIVLHSIILVTVAVGFFSPAMLMLYLAFVSPETIRQLPSRLQHWRNRRAATSTASVK